jgi:hypothetical protein
MQSLARTAGSSIGEAPFCCFIIPPRLRHEPPTIDSWRAYDRAKRRLVAIHGHGTQAYDEALRRYLESAAL